MAASAPEPTPSHTLRQHPPRLAEPGQLPTPTNANISRPWETPTPASREGAQSLPIPAIVPSQSATTAQLRTGGAPLVHQPTTFSSSSNPGSTYNVQPVQPRANIIMDWAWMRQTLSARIQQVKSQFLEVNDSIVLPRSRIIMSALASGDVFFLILHQIFCAWSLDTTSVHHLTTILPATMDNALFLLQTVLKPNTSMPADHLRWFASFPCAFPSQWPSAHLAPIGIFLRNFSRMWQTDLLPRVTNRGFPIRIMELRNELALASPSLETVLFTVARRHLGVPDGRIAQQMSAVFAQDQNNYNHESCATGQQDLSAVIVDAYRSLLRQSRVEVQNQGKQAQVPLNAGSSPGSANNTNGRRQQQQQQQSPALPSAQHHLQSHQSQNLHLQRQQERSQLIPNIAHPLATMQPATGGNIIHPSPLGNSRAGSFQMPSATDISQPSHHEYISPYPRHQGQSVQGYVSGSGPYHVDQQHEVSPLARQLSLNSTTQGPLSRSARPGQASLHSSGIVQPSARPRLTTNHPSALAPATSEVMRPNSLLPPRGVTLGIDRMAMSPYDKKSIDMALHQVDVASPRRVPRQLPPEQSVSTQEKHYQCIGEIVSGPLAIKPDQSIHQLDFEVSDDELKRLSTYSMSPGERQVLCDYFDGSLRFRLRVCEVDLNSRGSLSEAAWSTLSTQWPGHIYVMCNSQAVKIRRKLHNGQDQPAELTRLIRAGRNVLKLSVSNVTPKAGHATMVAVEKVVTLTHSRIMAMVSERGVLPAEATRRIVRERLTPVGQNGGDDDDVPIIFSNLSIDLADPFTATMFKIPVRGSSCTHLECFDLEVWLGTRLGKSTSVHSLKCGCGLCRRSRALGAEPSLTDKWKCPLCDKDARPGSLRVDGFMVEVREALVRRGLTRTKSINVGPDGTWSPKAEQPDSEDEEDVEADSQRPPKRAKTGHQTEVRGAVEVIVLD